nr:hypothetical protein [Ruminococcus albus]
MLRQRIWKSWQEVSRNTLSSEFYTRVNVGIGTVIEGVRDLARSFKEAQVSLESRQGVRY